MKAKISRGDRSGRSRAFDHAWREVVFSITEARRALPYVARVVGDAAEAFHLVDYCRRALAEHLGQHMRQIVCDRRDAALVRLNAAIDECNAVGADLLDLSRGIVGFKTVIRGRPASLVWRLGDPIDIAWQDLIEITHQVDCSQPFDQSDRQCAHAAMA